MDQSEDALATAIPCSFFSVSQNFCSSVKYLSSMKTLERPRVAISGTWRTISSRIFLTGNSLLDSIERMFLRAQRDAHRTSRGTRVFVSSAHSSPHSHIFHREFAQVENTRVYITPHRKEPSDRPILSFTFQDPRIGKIVPICTRREFRDITRRAALTARPRRGTFPRTSDRGR